MVYELLYFFLPFYCWLSNNVSSSSNLIDYSIVMFHGNAMLQHSNSSLIVTIFLSFPSETYMKDIKHLLRIQINKNNKSSRSPGPSCIFVAEAKLNSLVYFVYTLSAVCTVQLINTWHQAGLSRGFVDYSENGEQIHTQIHRHTHRGSYRVRPGLKIYIRYNL